MVALLGAFACMLVALGSGLAASGHVALGVALAGLGSIGLGTMFAALQSAATPHYGIDSSDGLTVRQLKAFLADTTWVTDDTKVYVGNNGMNVAGGIFTCLLDGGKAIVLERRVEQETDFF